MSRLRKSGRSAILQSCHDTRTRQRGICIRTALAQEIAAGMEQVDPCDFGKSQRNLFPIRFAGWKSRLYLFVISFKQWLTRKKSGIGFDHPNLQTPVRIARPSKPSSRPRRCSDNQSPYSMAERVFAESGRQSTWKTDLRASLFCH